MPKSKNRRKSKSKSDASAQTMLDAQSVDASDSSSDRGGEAVKKSSVGPIEFFQQVRSEARKVTWTSRGEVMVSTIMVLIMVAIMSLFFFAVDQLLRLVVPWILSLSLFS